MKIYFSLVCQFVDNEIITFENKIFETRTGRILNAFERNSLRTLEQVDKKSSDRS